MECRYSTQEVAHLLQKLTSLLSLLAKWLLLIPVKLLATQNAREGPNNTQISTDIKRKAMRESLNVATYGELMTLRNEKEEEGEETTCGVCLSEVEGSDRVWELRNCEHVFHKGCLDKWLEHDDQLTCPLCRAPLLTQSRAHQQALAEPSWAVERLLYLFGDDLMVMS